MQHREHTFQGLGGLTLYWQSWLPDGDPRAVLLVAHGFAEHSGRYMNLVRHFVPKGYAVYALDHRGHGRSEGERVVVDRFEDYTVDLKTFFDLVQAEQPGKRVFLVGHSMGSAVSLLYVLDHQDELAGLVLSGGGIAKPGEPVPAPPKRQPGDPPRPPLSTDFLSNDPQVIEDYVNDPLVYRGPMPDRFAMLEVRETLPRRVGEIRLPILIMAGGAVPDGARSTTLYEHVGSADKTLKVYEGLKHEIFNEREHPRVLGDLEAWLESRV